MSAYLYQFLTFVMYLGQTEDPSPGRHLAGAFFLGGLVFLSLFLLILSVL